MGERLLHTSPSLPFPHSPFPNRMNTDALRRAVRTIPDFPAPGIQFKDFTPLLADPALVRQAVEALAAPFAGFARAGVTKVVGIESRGFILGGLLAHRLEAGFVPVRKQGKLPYETARQSYALEYGTDAVELHTDALAPGDRVLIHDDVIATGGTAHATYRLVRSREQVEVVGFSFLMELEALGGRARLGTDAPVHVVLQV